MDLIFLHGPPAAGKLTVARSLQSLIPSRLVDNHAAIDFALTLFDFGAPGFWDLIARLRDDVLEAAVSSDLPYLITTGCYIHPEDLPLLEAWERILQPRGARLLPVHLTAEPSVLRARVGRADRQERGKLTSVSGLNEYLARNDYAAVPRSNCVQFDTARQSPAQTAQKIIEAHDLQKISDRD